MTRRGGACCFIAFCHHALPLEVTLCATGATGAAAEAVVRGYKLGLLSTADYNNLCQCETLEDIKLYLVRG